MIDHYQLVRKTTRIICEPLTIEDHVVQTMPDVSPPKWHLGHTTWFFEKFILDKFLKKYQSYNPFFDYVFNSYYETLGDHVPRCKRGTLSRPTLDEVHQYRDKIDHRIIELFDSTSPEEKKSILPLLELGIHHEQQHQELLLTDIKHIFWTTPTRPAYVEDAYIKDHVMYTSIQSIQLNLKSIEFPEGIYSIGHEGHGFAFDNEKPRHKIFLNSFALESRLVTQGEYLEFIEAGGYQNPSYWLSDGWNCVQRGNWNAPLYWEKIGTQWWAMTLRGMQPLHEHDPVSHVSFYEASAFAKWKERRLPTEAEWETAASSVPIDGNFLESGFYQPLPALTPQSSQSSQLSQLSQPKSTQAQAHNLLQLFGDVWEWTASSYRPYPGFQPWPGPVGEYNGKFMCNQMVLKGGACVTPKSHIRPTYRNFFAPDSRWQFTGFRLAGT